MFPTPLLVAALLLAAPSVRDHLDLDPFRDGGDVRLDGDRALVTEGGSLRFYRFAGGRWMPEPMDGVPGGGLIALAGERAVVAEGARAWAVAFTRGAWRMEAALQVPGQAAAAPIRAVALAPGGRRVAVASGDSAVLFTRGPDGFVASPLPTGAPALGVAIDDHQLVVATKRSVLVFKDAGPKPVATLGPKIDPTPNGKPFVLTGRVTLHGDDLAIGYQAKDFPAFAVVVLHRTGAEWAQAAVLRGSDPGSREAGFFGAAFALSGDRLLVGEPQPWSPRGCGRAFLFERSGKAWSTPLPVTDPSRCTSHAFGGAVALSGRHAMIAATVAGRGYYEGGAVQPGRPRRVFFFDLEGQAHASPFEALGVRPDRPGDWAGTLEGTLVIDQHTEQRRSGVRLAVSRAWEGVEASLCVDPGCLDGEVVGHRAEPGDTLSITSGKLAQLMESRLFVAGDVATGTLRRVEDRLVAELAVARTGVSARLELSAAGDRDVDALLRQRSVAVTSGPPPDAYAGAWLGAATLPDGRELAMWMRLAPESTWMLVEWCIGPDAGTCRRAASVSLAEGALRFVVPWAPVEGRWAAVPARVELRLVNDALQGSLAIRYSTEETPLTFRRLGDRSLADGFERVRAANAARASEKSRDPRGCVCACWCGAAQPRNACSWDECNCQPCPPGVP
jgi:hypothetical protein